MGQAALPCVGSERARKWQLSRGGSPLRHDRAGEAEELGGPAAGRRRHAAGLFDQPLLIDQPAEVLLVKTLSGERFDGTLELKQREGWRHQLEDDRAIFDLRPQPGKAGGEDAAMIQHHWRARERRGPAGVALPGLGAPPRLLEEPVALPPARPVSPALVLAGS